MTKKISEKIVKNRPLTSRAHSNREHTVVAIRSHLERESSILRPRQVKTVHKIADKYEEGSTDIYVDIPTGVGKTVVSSQVINGVYQDGYKPRILFVTDSQHLVEQTKARFNQFAPHLDVGMYYQYQKDTTNSIIATTYNSYPYFAENHAEEFDYVFYDEAHKALSARRLLHRQKFKNALLIALTATPAYSDSKDLAQFFDLADRLTVPEAIDEELICGFRSVLIPSHHANLDDIPLNNKGDYDEKALVKEINTHARNLSAAEFYRDEIDLYTGLPLLGKRGILNCGSVQHAYDAAKVFQDTIPRHMIGGKDVCVAIHGKSKYYPEMSPKLRKEILAAHENGEILMLAQRKILIHGHDDPGIELCFNLAPTLSLVDVQQRAGRSLRLDKSNPGKFALIIDVLDQTSRQDRKPLIYGDVVGLGHYIPSNIEGTFTIPPIKPPGPPGPLKEKLLNEEELKKLKAIWHVEEVYQYVKNNATIREQDLLARNKRLLLGSKQEDEFSSTDIAEQEKVSWKIVNTELNKLVPMEGKQEQYIYPDDTNDTPFIYYGAERIGPHGQIRVLKKQSVRPFLDNIVLKGRKQEDELSAEDMGRQEKIARETILPELNNLIPYEGQEGQYIHPDDTSDNPFVYYGAERMGNQGQIRVLKKQSVRPFLDNIVLKGRKQEDELSSVDISNQEKVSDEIIRVELNNLIPYEGKEGKYIHPDDTSDNPFVYYGAERKGPKGQFRVLKKQSVRPFLDNIVLKDRKKEDELSAVDIVEQEKIDHRIVNAELNNLIPYEGQEGQYIHPDDTSDNPFVYYGAERKVPKGQIRVLKKQSVRPFLDNIVLKDRKQEDELSVVDMSKLEKTHYTAIYAELNNLISYEGKEGQYIHPDDTSDNPFVYYGAERKGPKGQMRVLKKQSVRPFLDNIVLKDRKKEDELSAVDIVEQEKVSHRIVNTELNNLIPYEGKEGQYIHPDDTSDNPFVYYGAERSWGRKKIRVLKRGSVQPFLDNIILKDRKKDDELSSVDISNQEKVSYKTVNTELNNLIPYEGKEGQYIHPDDTNDNPFVYYGAERIDKKYKIRVLKKQSVRPFLDNIILKDRKKEDELSPLDLTEVFIIGNKAASTLLENYKPLEKNCNTYIHCSGKFKETIEMITRKKSGKEFLCLKENSVDIIAQQNNLEYHDPEMKEKYSKLAKQKPE